MTISHYLPLTKTKTVHMFNSKLSQILAQTTCYNIHKKDPEQTGRRVDWKADL